MTTKHFRLIAATLRATKPTKRGIGDVYHSMAQWNLMVQEFAANLGAISPRFDVEKFLDACGFDA